MPKPASDLYKVSNNPRAPRGGKVLAGAASRVKKAAKTVSLGKKGRPDATEVPSSPSKDTQPRIFKRRDLKATPPSHAATKAKESAGRDDSAPKPAADPVAGLNSGAGALGGGEGPPKPVDLDSSAKTLFPKSTGDKKKAAPKTTDFFTFDESEALEVALEEAKREREQAELEDKSSEDEGASITNISNDSPVDEYSGEVAVVATDDGMDGAEAEEEDKDEAGSTGVEEEQLISEIKAVATNAQEFLASYHRILELLNQAESELYDRDGDRMDTDDLDVASTNTEALERRVSMLERVQRTAAALYGIHSKHLQQKKASIKEMKVLIVSESHCGAVTTSKSIPKLCIKDPNSCSLHRKNNRTPTTLVMSRCIDLGMILLTFPGGQWAIPLPMGRSSEISPEVKEAITDSDFTVSLTDGLQVLQALDAGNTVDEAISVLWLDKGPEIYARREKGDPPLVQIDVPLTESPEQEQDGTDVGVTDPVEPPAVETGSQKKSAGFGSYSDAARKTGNETVFFAPRPVVKVGGGSISRETLARFNISMEAKSSNIGAKTDQEHAAYFGDVIIRVISEASKRTTNVRGQKLCPVLANVKSTEEPPAIAITSPPDTALSRFSELTMPDKRSILEGYLGDNNDNQQGYKRQFSTCIALNGDPTDRDSLRRVIQVTFDDLFPELNAQVYNNKLHSSHEVVKAGFFLNVPAMTKIFSIQGLVYSTLRIAFGGNPPEFTVHSVLMMADKNATKNYYEGARKQSEGRTTGNQKLTDEWRDEINTRQVLTISCAPDAAPKIAITLAKAFSTVPEYQAMHSTTGTRTRFRPDPALAVMVTERPFFQLQIDQAKVQYEWTQGQGQTIPLSGFSGWSINAVVPELNARPATILPSFTDKDGQNPFLAVVQDANGNPFILAFGFRIDATDLGPHLVIWFVEQLKLANAEASKSTYLSPMGMALSNEYEWDGESNRPRLKDGAEYETQGDEGLEELGMLRNPLASTAVSFSPLEIADNDVGSVRSRAQKKHQEAQRGILRQGEAKYSPTASVHPLSTPGAKPVKAKSSGAKLAKLDENGLTNREAYRVLNHLGITAILLGKTEGEFLRKDDSPDLVWNLRAALREGFNEYKKATAIEAITRIKEVIDFEKHLSDDELSTASAMSDISTASSVDSEASAVSDAEEIDEDDDQKNPAIEDEKEEEDGNEKEESQDFGQVGE